MIKEKRVKKFLEENPNYFKSKLTTSEYRIWSGMKSRCRNKNNKDYSNYGGRGITISNRWLNSFDNFLKDMVERKSSTHSIDRINNNKGYSKENCKWSTSKEQLRNKRNNRLITFEGETKCMAEWVEKFSISRFALYKRLKAGWSIKNALTKPIRKINY